MQDRGFTLIEVLIAFTILAVVLAGSFAAIGSGLSQERTAGATVARVLAARSILDGIGIETRLAEGVVEGRLPSGELWQVSLQRVDEDDAAGSGPTGPALYLAELTIFDAGRSVLELATLRLGP